MTKDSKGVELKVGDTVLISATVQRIVNDKTVSIEIENWNWLSCPSKQLVKVTEDNLEETADKIA